MTQLLVSCVAPSPEGGNAAANALFINLRERVSKLSLINFRRVGLLNMP